MDEQAESSASGASKPRSRCLYTAAAANRASQIADWVDTREDGGNEGEVELVYASHRSIAIAPGVTSRHPKPVQLFPTKHGLVTVLKLAYNRCGQGRPRIVAGTDDGWLYVYDRNSRERRWRQTAAWHVKESSKDAASAVGPSSGAPPTRKKPGVMPGRKTANDKPAVSIRALGVFRKRGLQEFDDGDGEGSLVVSATSDGEMQIWSLGSGDEADHKLVQRSALGRTRAETRTEILPLDIVLTALPGSKAATLLAVAGTDNKISLHLGEDDNSFRKLFAIAGHTDWVRSLDICQASPTSSRERPAFLLASGAQDNHIRLWRIDGNREDQAKVEPTTHVDDFDKLASEIEDANASEAIATKSQTFSSGSFRWYVSFDALLTGHEHWVTGVRWCPPPHSEASARPAALLSSSADNSVILWTPSSGLPQAMSSLEFASFDLTADHSSHEQNVWVSVHRFGEIGNTGSAANGMYGAAWHPNAGDPGKSQQAVIGHGYGGAIHIWARETDSAGKTSPWQARPGRGGHFAAANALQWEPEGAYFISAGSDKTTRLHGALRDSHGESWHEMARPQTHGYEMMSAAWLSRLAFASAGDEKTIRVFEAPQGFVQSAEKLGMTRERKHSNLLVLKVANIGQLCNPSVFASAIKAATRESLEHHRLVVCIASPLFASAGAGTPPSVSFEQVEHFLKWCYAMSWGVAVEQASLLFDVDILLGDESREEELLRSDTFDTIYTTEDDESIPSAWMRLKNSDAGGEPLPVSKEPSQLEQREAIAMGGTFDHLHVGHKILLSMACLVATRRIVVGVTDDSMLTKKKQAHLLEPIADRIARVSGFMQRFCNHLGRPLQYDVVKLQDVAGPAGTDKDLSALLFTDETVGGADFIDGVREKNGLEKLGRLCIGVIGASGETNVKGKDASELAAAKVGSTAIREWLAKQSEEEDDAPKPSALSGIPTLSGEPRPIGASVPPLGLSNRAIHGTSLEGTGHDEPFDGPSESGQAVGKATRAISSQLSRPPVEEELHNHSIWTEVTKLYGHQFELLALDAEIEHGLIASSCRANQAETAAVRLHDSRRGWKDVQTLMGHSLGATRVRFSPDGQYLVSVSRDRSWRLYMRRSELDVDGKEPFQEVCAREEAHGRIIYDVAWVSAETFATSSRDGNVKIWSTRSDTGQIEPQSIISLRSPVTAIAVDRSLGWFAAGTESGSIYIYVFKAAKEDWQQILDLGIVHADAIHEMAWQPRRSDTGNAASNILASAGKDGTVRLIEITL